MGFDTVIVMDKSEVGEMGRLRQLADREGSRFRELWLVGNKG